MNTSNQIIIPFLKWAGGKRWLMGSYKDLFPIDFKRYIEPFLGSGAVYFSIQPRKAVLTDVNPALIEAYQALNDDWKKIYTLLKKHQKLHSRNYYYRVRQSQPRSPYGRAARFIYLNRTCWNGLYRVNKKGNFNVPIGTRTNILFDTDCFESTSQLLGSAKIYKADFEEVIVRAKHDDFIFADPPYTVLHNKNNFVKYNENLFSWEDQIRLRDVLIDANKRGVKFLVTNADHPMVKELYKNIRGFNLTPVCRTTTISSKPSSRGKISELVIRNYK